jgi:hypothetical protein
MWIVAILIMIPRFQFVLMQTCSEVREADLLREVVEERVLATARAVAGQ